MLCRWSSALDRRVQPWGDLTCRGAPIREAVTCRCPGVQAHRGRQSRWRSVNATHLVALVRAGARFHRGKLVERPEGTEEVMVV